MVHVYNYYIIIQLFTHILLVKNYVISMARKIAYHIARNIGSDNIWWNCTISDIIKYWLI